MRQYIFQVISFYFNALASHFLINKVALSLFYKVFHSLSEAKLKPFFTLFIYLLHIGSVFLLVSTTQLIWCPLLHSTNKRGGLGFFRKFLSALKLSFIMFTLHVRPPVSLLPRCIFSVLGIPGAALRHHNDFSQASQECYLESWWDTINYSDISRAGKKEEKLEEDGFALL